MVILVKISVFTPTYNRKDKLIVLFESLKSQTYKNFEWIIVDDGSIDDTESVVSNIIQEFNDFNIIYKKQKNSGKHVAINTGVDLATGDLFFIVDSDDVLPQNSLETIIETVEMLNPNVKYAGIAGLKGFSDTEIVGKTFAEEYIECTSLDREKYNITGDKAEVFFTEVLRKYKFPSFENENFITETVVWYEIANDGYKFRWFNKIIYICEYCEDGLSKKNNKFYDNYEGFIYQVSKEVKYKQLDKKNRLKQLLICFGYSKYKNYDIKVLAKKFNYSTIKAKFIRMIGYFILKNIYKKQYGD